MTCSKQSPLSAAELGVSSLIIIPTNYMRIQTSEITSYFLRRCQTCHHTYYYLFDLKTEILKFQPGKPYPLSIRFRELSSAHQFLDIQRGTPHAVWSLSGTRVWDDTQLLRDELAPGRALFLGPTHLPAKSPAVTSHHSCQLHR